MFALFNFWGRYPHFYWEPSTVAKMMTPLIRYDMNIFYTNSDPIIAAREHCNRHNIKMILEYAQMLSTTHHFFGSEVPGIYKSTHVNHPSTIWVRESSQHYMWLYECAKELCKQYTLRTGKVHKTESVIDALIEPPPVLLDQGFNEPPVAAPDEFRGIKIFQGAEKAYQAYLNSKFKEWLSREKPLDVVFVNKPEWVNV